MNGRELVAVEKAIAAVETCSPGASVQVVAADLSTAEGCNALVSKTPLCDILINNLGIYGTIPFFEISDEKWDRYWNVNIMSGVHLSRAYMLQMLRRNWGRVVFIASESALSIPADMVHYGMSKTAMLGLARGLAKVAAGTGVTVNSVLPGPTLSEGAEKILMVSAPVG